MAGKWLWIAFAALLIGAAGVLFISYQIPSHQTQLDKLEMPGVCLACQKESLLKTSSQDSPPFECPKCRQRAAQEWLYCFSCERRFVPALVNGRVPAGQRCTGCGSESVGAYVPGMYIPKGDVPLPKPPS